MIPQMLAATLDAHRGGVGIGGAYDKIGHSLVGAVCDRTLLLTRLGDPFVAHSSAVDQFLAQRLRKHHGQGSWCWCQIFDHGGSFLLGRRILLRFLGPEERRQVGLHRKAGQKRKENFGINGGTTTMGIGLFDQVTDT